MFVLWRVSAQITPLWGRNEETQDHRKERGGCLKSNDKNGRDFFIFHERRVHSSSVKDIRRKRTFMCTLSMKIVKEERGRQVSVNFLGYVFLNAVNKEWKPLMTRSTTMMMIEKSKEQKRKKVIARGVHSPQ